MSELPGNPHAKEALKQETLLGDTLASEGITDSTIVAEAQLINARATLALAYEQRTATLVHALLSDSLVTDGKYDEIQAEVRKRLGLGADR